MSAEVENQEQQKELPTGLNEAIGEMSSCWPQSMSIDGKMETGDSGSVKSVGTASSGVGCVPPFGKDDDKSSTESLGSGGIWGQKVGFQPDNAWPGHGGIDWSISSDGNKDGSKGYPWSSSTMQDGQGTTNALGLSVDFWKPNALGSYGSSSGSNGWGEPRVNSWALPDSKTEFNKEGLPDKRIGGTDQESSKGLWGGRPEERKVEPIGPVQRRSASLTELNVTFDSLSLGGESVKFSSTGKMGLNDERSQPDGAEVSQQNREELIMKMINSNEGWGKKPIIQETPWNMDSVAVVPPVAEPLPAAAEDAAVAKNDSVFWNTPKESSNSGWNSAPAPAPATTYEWAPDSDIGMWNGPPPPESVNPNMWTGPPKEPSPVWVGGGQGGMAQVAADKAMLSSGTMGWSDRGFHGSGMDKLQKEFGRDGGMDRMRGSDSWVQQPPRGTFDNNWTSTEVNTWSLPHPADQQHDSWAMKQPLNSFPSSGFGLGGKPEPISKIGTWGESTVTETGLWNQQQPLSNIQNPLQQLMDLGLKKEDAIYLQNNMSADKLLELMRLQKDNEPPKGRIIRGKSMVEMPSNDQFGHFQGNRNSGFQAGGRGAMYQSSGPGNIPQQMHMKGSGMQQSGGGGWPGMGGTQVYGRTPSVPMGNTSLMQPVPQMNPMMHQTLLQLQSLLQPLLQQRAQIQHNRSMTPMQKAIQIEQLNVQINEVKRHIDQVQLLFGPPPGAITPNTMNSVPDPQLGGFDEAKMMQLLGLKQNRDFGGMSHPSLGSVSELPMVDAKTSIGGIPNLSMDQMAAFMNSNRWLSPDQSAGLQLLGKDKLPSGDMLVDSLSNLGQSGGSKMGWPGVPGDFGMPKGSRPPPPPGLDKTDMFYNRSTSWAPGEKLKTSLPGQGCMISWLMLKNVPSTLDPGTLQKICLLYGPLQNFYYSKISGQALACYINRDDALSALSNISQNVHSSGPSTRLIAELVAPEDIGRVIDNSWTAIPPSFGPASSGAKTNAMRSGSSGWEGM